MVKRIQSLAMRYLASGSFGGNVVTLMGATIISQGVLVLTSPILTRLYAPSDFGIFALYMSIFSILSVIATGRYELTIVLPEKDEDSLNIIILIMIMLFGFSFLIFVAGLFLNKPISSLLKAQELARWLYFMPITVVFSCFYHTFNYWLIRKKRYKSLAFNRILQSLIIVAVSLLMGFRKAGALGLILGVILGNGIVSLIMVFSLNRKNQAQKEKLNIKEIIRLAKKYVNFPIYSVPGGVVNSANSQVPNILLSIFFGTTVTGFFSLTQRVLASPVSVMANSVLDVFKERASSDYRKYGNCRDIYVKTFKSLFLLSFLPFVIFLFFAPWLFSFLFGERWRVAGEYAQILSPMFFFGFIASPLSYIFYIAQKQNYDFIFQIFLFFLTSGSILGGVYLKNVKIGLLCFSLSYSAFYIIYFLFSYHFSKGKQK